MTTEGHEKGLGGIISRRKEDVKEKEFKKKMTNEKSNRELAKIKVQLDVLMELLQ